MRRLKFRSARLVVCMAIAVGAVAQAQPDATRTPVDPVLERTLKAWPAGRIDTVKHPGEWGYEEGVLLDGLWDVWRVTGDPRIFAYVQAAVDRSVDKDGLIHMDNGAAYPVAEHQLDMVEMGRITLGLYRVTRDERYLKAVEFLRGQLLQQPKNTSGGWWHKQIYPNQMWLDGAYMAGPFLENYGKMMGHQEDMDAVAEQLILMDRKMRDRQTGLLAHGWDESIQMGWADKKTGLSPEHWARAMGWYAVATVDVLERMNATDPQHAALEDVVRRTLTAVGRFQDADTGLWWDVLDKPTRQGNFPEASASAMFVYALAKATRIGYAPAGSMQRAVKGWEGIQKRFVAADGTLSGTVKVSGLGGNPYRSGTFEYYVGEPVGDNDAKGVGAYLMALSEMVQRARAADLFRKAHNKTVLLDAWFNSQRRPTPAGRTESYHYKWSDESDTGYSTWGHLFQQYGMQTDVLDHAPRAEDLKGADIYIIVSPDNEAVNPQPHFMDKESADVIEAWVKQGGTLVLMENDSSHADQKRMNMLSERFGIHFNEVIRNRGPAEDYAATIVNIPAGAGGIFRHQHKALMMETTTLTVSGEAKPVLNDHGTADAHGDLFMATAEVGKGTVFANVDPWLYNEFTDGRKLPLGEDNFACALELTAWLVTTATR